MSEVLAITDPAITGALIGRFSLYIIRKDLERKNNVLLVQQEQPIEDDLNSHRKQLQNCDDT